jgi:hypothetical protein
MNPKLQKRLLKATQGAYWDIQFLLAMLPDELRETCAPQQKSLEELNSILSKCERAMGEVVLG